MIPWVGGQVTHSALDEAGAPMITEPCGYGSLAAAVADLRLRA